MPRVTDNRRRGWFWIHNLVLDEWGPELGPIGLACYLALCRHANQDGECYPSKKTLAEEIGASKRTVDAAIAKMVDIGLIEIEHRKDKAGDATSNLYTLLEPPIRAQYEERQRAKQQDSVLSEAEPTETVSEESPLAPQAVDTIVPDRVVKTGSPLSASPALPVVQEVHGGSAGDAPPVVQELHYPPPHDKGLTESMHRFLRLQLSRTSFEGTFYDSMFAAEGDTLIVYVITQYARDWAQARLAKMLTRTANEVLAKSPGQPGITAVDVRVMPREVLM